MIFYISRSSLTRRKQGRPGKISEDMRRLGTIDNNRGRYRRTGMMTGETVEIGDGTGLSGTWRLATIGGDREGSVTIWKYQER